MFGLFLAVTAIFAKAAVAAVVLQWPTVVTQIVFTPLVACLSIWIGMGISTRTRDTRVAQQFAAMSSLPVVAVTYPISLNIITPTAGLAIGLGVLLIVLDVLGWRLVSAAFGRERLIVASA